MVILRADGEPTGDRTTADLLESFDHTAWAQLPSYYLVHVAMQRLVVELVQQMDIAAGVEDLADVVREMSLVWQFPDVCHDHCEKDWNPAVDEPPPMPYPHRIERNGDWLTCHYRCPRCTRTWTCGYSVAAGA